MRGKNTETKTGMTMKPGVAQSMLAAIGALVKMAGKTIAIESHLGNLSLQFL